MTRPKYRGKTDPQAIHRSLEVAERIAALAVGGEREAARRVLGSIEFRGPLVEACNDPDLTSEHLELLQTLLKLTAHAAGYPDRLRGQQPKPESTEAIKLQCQAIRSALALKAASEGATEEKGGDTAAVTTRGKQKGTANDRMLAAVQDDLNKVSGWTAKQWSEHLKCVPSTVVDTATWKDLAMARERLKADHAKTKRRKPRASDQRRD